MGAFGPKFDFETGWYAQPCPLSNLRYVVPISNQIISRLTGYLWWVRGGCVGCPANRNGCAMRPGRYPLRPAQRDHARMFHGERRSCRRPVCQVAGRLAMNASRSAPGVNHSRCECRCRKRSCSCSSSGWYPSIAARQTSTSELCIPPIFDVGLSLVYPILMFFVMVP
jgi:hypothetical protein